MTLYVFRRKADGLYYKKVNGYPGITWVDDVTKATKYQNTGHTGTLHNLVPHEVLREWGWEIAWPERQARAVDYVREHYDIVPLRVEVACP